MVRISKQKIKKETAEAINSQLVSSIMHTHSKRDASALFSELMTDSEQVVLAKRFAIIAMLTRDYSFAQIQQLLKVSPDTIGRVWCSMKRGQYEHLVRYAKNNPKKFDGSSLSSLLDDLARGGILPPRGRGRWKEFRRAARTSTYYD